jgi:hypothetical protein
MEVEVLVGHQVGQRAEREGEARHPPQCDAVRRYLEDGGGDTGVHHPPEGAVDRRGIGRGHARVRHPPLDAHAQ